MSVVNFNSITSTLKVVNDAKKYYKTTDVYIVADNLSKNGYKITAKEIKNLEETEYYNNVEVYFRNDY